MIERMRTVIAAIRVVRLIGWQMRWIPFGRGQNDLMRMPIDNRTAPGFQAQMVVHMNDRCFILCLDFVDIDYFKC